jgi:ParB-like chromosome segregation protein Spo0J
LIKDEQDKGEKRISLHFEQVDNISQPIEKQKKNKWKQKKKQKKTTRKQRKKKNKTKKKKEQNKQSLKDEGDWGRHYFATNRKTKENKRKNKKKNKPWLKMNKIREMKGFPSISNKLTFFGFGGISIFLSVISLFTFCKNTSKSEIYSLNIPQNSFFTDFSTIFLNKSKMSFSMSGKKQT